MFEFSGLPGLLFLGQLQRGPWAHRSCTCAGRRCGHTHRGPLPLVAMGAASSQRPLCACSGGLSPKAICVQAYLSTRQVTAARTHCPAGHSLPLSCLSRAGVRQGCRRPRSSWAELLGPPSGCALPTAAPERRQFEKATGTRPRVTRLGWPWPVKGAAVCVCRPEPSFPLRPHWLLSAGSVPLPRDGGGGSGVPAGLPLSLSTSALPHDAGRPRRPFLRPGSAQPGPKNWTQLQNGASGRRQSAQEVQSKAQREKAGRGGEEGVPGARVRQVPDRGLRAQGAGAAAPRATTFFHHVNLQYSTISEFCTGDACQTMAVCNTQYYWYDERGKKVKCTAPQYVDFVMSSVQKLVTDEDVFPTKYGREFPSSFESLVKKICRYLFHVLAHIYSSHFKETLALELHGHLNTLYVHFILFAREFNLLDPKETAIMDDLTEVLCSGGGPGGGGASGGGTGAQNHVKER
ncbi:MOB kinase activator 2 isoform X2 [Rhinolophus sinicus]|uniref:MOB kinase activator 2 isoform X2 n=1 Tax=Rhinolophus sinicus TaxID=89399 RepID=UPI003D7B7ABF